MNKVNHLLYQYDKSYVHDSINPFLLCMYCCSFCEAKLFNFFNAQNSEVLARTSKYLFMHVYVDM